MTGSIDEETMKEVLSSMRHRGPHEGSDILLDHFHMAH